MRRWSAVFMDVAVLALGMWDAAEAVRLQLALGATVAAVTKRHARAD